MKISIFMFSVCFAAAWLIILFILSLIEEKRPKKHCEDCKFYTHRLHDSMFGNCSKSFKSGKSWPSNFSEACSYYKCKEYKDLNDL